MRRKIKKPNQTFENITVLSAGAEGNCVAKTQEKVIFIKHAVPGDVVDLKVVNKKKKILEAVITKIHKPSENRVEPFCSHFGVCGGCKWQQMDYETQLKYKTQQVIDAFERIGKIDTSGILPIVPSAKTTYYRNKLEFTFSNKRWLSDPETDQGKDMNALGFHIPGRFDKVLDIDHCYHQSSPSNEIRLEVKKFALENDYSFFDLKLQEGFMRNLIIRTSSLGELMVIVSFFYEDVEKREALLNHLAAKFPEINSLMYVINPKRNDTISDLEIKLYKGKDHINEKMEDLIFKIGPKSFFQTNSEQALELYKITRDYAGLTGNELVYDLYTGTGTIALFVAKKASKVVGLEYVEQAIEDAWVNAENNNMKHTSFFAGDIKDLLKNEFVSEHGTPDVVITDPPRAGMHEDVVRQLMEMRPKRIVYVSCNPATQARDLEIMKELYSIDKIQPVDMFPHTHHVENVVLLNLKP